MSAAIVEHAMACVGTPYRHQGRLIGVGLDCAGVVIHALRAAGVAVVDHAGYPRTPFDGMLKKMADAEPALIQVSADDMQPGDVLLLRINTAPQHLAVYVGDGYMVHAYSHIGRVVKQRVCSDWRGKVVAVYRVAA